MGGISSVVGDGSLQTHLATVRPVRLEMPGMTRFRGPRRWAQPSELVMLRANDLPTRILQRLLLSVTVEPGATVMCFSLALYCQLPSCLS